MSTFLRSIVVAVLLLGPTSASSQELSLERVWAMGDAFGSEAETWHRLEDATVVNGHVVAVDMFLPTVRVFTVGGEYVGDLGRDGAGPSEYVAPVSVRADRDGFEVWDLAQRRSVRWGIQGGEFVHEHTTLEAGSGGLTWLRAVRGGGKVGWTAMASSRGENDENETRHLIVHASGAGTDTVAVVDGNPIRLMLRGQSGPRIDTRPSPFAAGGGWLFGDSLLVVVDGWEGRADLYQAGEAGMNLVRTDSLPARASAVRSGPADEEKMTRWWMRFNGVEDLADSRVERVLAPERLPAWSSVLGDDRGNAWIRDGSVARLSTEEGERWLRWNLADDSFAWVEVPRGVQVFRFREGHMVGRERGALGEARLVLYRIVP